MLQSPPDTALRGRFAPSPSGYMHLGNAFSALLAWLSARSRGGEFVLRLEDLDKRCERLEFHDALFEDLRWLGIDWDGEVVTQSLRTRAYESALNVIRNNAEVYPCFCTRADLHAASAPHASDGTPIYAGTCYGLSDEDIYERSASRDPALRLHVPDIVVSVEDGCLGHYEQNLKIECGDFVLRRTDGVFAYQLACVVDDIAAGVTEVVRANDLLSSTPRQVYLYELLGAQPPRYYHHPLLTDKSGRRLSKRDADLELRWIRENGTTPEELTGALAHYAGLIDEAEPVRAYELIESFSWDRVSQRDIVIR